MTITMALAALITAPRHHPDGNLCNEAAALGRQETAKTRVLHKTKASRRNDALVMGFGPALLFVCSELTKPL
ncbi:hypothetical protein HUU61_08790 [Rhodopseudomonas palustris]|nr:hypothetical protein [Rhodopseudomonas palustris]